MRDASVTDAGCADPEGCIEVLVRKARIRQLEEEEFAQDDIEREYRLLATRKTHRPLQLVDRQWLNPRRPAESTSTYDFEAKIAPIELPEKH